MLNYSEHTEENASDDEVTIFYKNVTNCMMHDWNDTQNRTVIKNKTYLQMECT